MLLPREKRILEILYAKKQGYTSSELAAALHISLRTVKTDIKRIREELEKTGCEIQKQERVYGCPMTVRERSTWTVFCWEVNVLHPWIRKPESIILRFNFWTAIHIYPLNPYQIPCISAKEPRPTTLMS